MKVQRVQLPGEGGVTWVVLGDDYLPIGPIADFLSYLRNIERSPNTVRAYAHHLKLYWEFLTANHLNWTTIGLTQLAEFAAWLRLPTPNVIPLQPQESQRTEVTVNTILTAVCMFYDFHERTETVKNIPLYTMTLQPGRRYKSLLHHINKSKPVRTRLIKLKQTKYRVKTLTSAQVQEVINACSRLRDKFLVSLLYETGLRIGAALGLRHEDIRSWDGAIDIVPRNDNPNGARAKTHDAFSVDVSRELMALYSDYLLNEFNDTDSDFVFVNLWDGEVGTPMSYSAVNDLFQRLSQRVGFHVHPHKLRHTHGTELARAGWDVLRIKKRLNHRHVQTVIDTYLHLDEQDMKQAYQDYLDKQGRVDHDPETNDNSGSSES